MFKSLTPERITEWICQWKVLVVRALAAQGKESYAIPLKVIGDKATECYAKFEVGDYIETEGEIIRPNPNSMYVLCGNIICRKPKSKKEYYVKTTDFLSFYSPESVIDRVYNKSSKKGEK